jgi:hypothetical protein
MAVVKESHVAPQMAQYDKRHVLPVVVIRHPLAWLQSMCAHSYAASWKHDKLHCPNFVPNNDVDIPKFGKTVTSFPVTVKFDETDHVTFDSLIHLWNEWYRQYLDVDYPILVGACCFCFVSTNGHGRLISQSLTVVVFYVSSLFRCSQTCTSAVRYEEYVHIHSKKPHANALSSRRTTISPMSFCTLFILRFPLFLSFFPFQQHYTSLVFQPHLVLHEIAQCVGGTVRSPKQKQVNHTAVELI